MPPYLINKEIGKAEEQHENVHPLEDTIDRARTERSRSVGDSLVRGCLMWSFLCCGSEEASSR